MDLSGVMMVETIHKTGPWNLKDLDSIAKNSYKVMSCFHCMGGSTMGYKLSGFEVLGGVEIDEKMMKVYRENHNPKFSFKMSINEFNKLKDIPSEFRNLDILDGSPPCSSFSASGDREKSWGKKKKFREGQELQVLDDLFFSFIETARMLQPKIVVAENVKGLIIGKAKGYVKQIYQMLNIAGFETQLFLLNSAFMGVPQKRERVFFISRRKDLKLDKLNLNFRERPVNVRQAFQNLERHFKKGKKITGPKTLELWKLCKPGRTLSTVHLKKSRFNAYKINVDEVAPTICANNCFFHPDEPIHFSGRELARLQSFPDDFKIKNENQLAYGVGMSVPPYMMNRISKQIELQWLNPLYGKKI